MRQSDQALDRLQHFVKGKLGNYRDVSELTL
jgi:hypothetical protein